MNFEQKGKFKYRPDNTEKILEGFNNPEYMIVRSRFYRVNEELAPTLNALKSVNNSVFRALFDKMRRNYQGFSKRITMISEWIISDGKVYFRYGEAALSPEDKNNKSVGYMYAAKKMAGMHFQRVTEIKSRELARWAPKRVIEALNRNKFNKEMMPGNKTTMINPPNMANCQKET